MDIGRFCAAFEAAFPLKVRHEANHHYTLCPVSDIEGMMSVKKQMLLNLAYSHLEQGEGYLEIGSWRGKSLISAMLGNEPRPSFACDNFSEFLGSKNPQHNAEEILARNIKRYGMDQHITLYNEPFQQIFTAEKLPVPIGLYHYDAAHDEQSQYLGVKLAEPFLTPHALVIIDDWRFASDSDSYAKKGTLRAVSESCQYWDLLYELPARRNGDHDMWWNGVALLAFRRK